MKLSQSAKLEKYLRGTGKTLTAAEARARFGIQNLRARMSDLRALGLVIRTETASTTGKTKYAVSARDVFGSRAKAFVSE
jgi:hypothetical protein